MTTINIIHNGIPLQRFAHSGKTYVVCPDSGDFEVEVVVNSNGGYVRREVCVSVDGLSVMDGKGATVSTRGYVTSDSKLRLPGWRLSDRDVAKFTFSTAEGSYAASKGPEAQRNVGCVGVVVFAERQRELVYRGVEKGVESIMSYCATSPTRSASVGAGFGARQDFATTSTTFERGHEVGREVVYYRTRQWLRDAGIPVPGEGGHGEAWPGDAVACAPPAGWRG